ncbi:MAG: hypothetical protein ACRD12_04545 [Acidimicrobiales bacterium]
MGVIDGVAAAALYLIGWERAFSFDASRTVGQFVTAGSLGEVFGQDRFNNHPLFSLVEHIVFVVTGSSGERLMRLVPILCGALAVGLVGAAAARRWGGLAGHVAGLGLTLNPLAVRQFREVRGYALVTLAAVVATLLLFSLRRRPRATTAIAYTGALAAGIATHLFALGLVPVHAFVVLGSQPRPRLRPWVGRWVAAVAAGLLVQMPAIADGLRTPPHSVFAPTFPLRLAANLLGGAALPAMAVLVGVGALVLLRSRAWVAWALAGTAALLAASWIASPSWLDSRFFICLVPAAAVAAGVAVAHRPALAWLAGAGLAVQLVAAAPGLGQSEVANRTAAGFVRAAQARGATACALGRTRAGLLAYVDIPVQREALGLQPCDVAVEAAGPTPEPLLGAACARFRYVLALPAMDPGALFADAPLSADRGWERTIRSPVCSG